MGSADGPAAAGGEVPGSEPAGDGQTASGRQAPGGGQAPGGSQAPGGGQVPGSGRMLGNGQVLSGGEAGLLGELRALRRQTRAARQAYWFPLLVFGLLICASVPFYVQRPRAGASALAWSGVSGSGPASPFLGGYPAEPGDTGVAWYWTAALLSGLLLTLAWYRWHARRAGVATSARPYLVTAVVLTVAAIAVAPLRRIFPAGWRVLDPVSLGDLYIRGTCPLLIIAVSLLALIWAERSVVLAVTAVLYGGAALLANLYDVQNLVFRLGWYPPPADQALLNVLLPGLVLVAGAAAGFAARQHRSPA